MIRYLLPLALVLSSACAGNMAVRTDPAVIAQRATNTLKVLDVVVDAVIAARDAGWISQPVTVAIQNDIKSAVPVIQKTPDGAKPIAIAALTAAGRRVGSDNVRAYLRWAAEAIQELP